MASQLTLLWFFLNIWDLSKLYFISQIELAIQYCVLLLKFRVGGLGTPGEHMHSPFFGETLNPASFHGNKVLCILSRSPEI